MTSQPQDVTGLAAPDRLVGPARSWWQIVMGRVLTPLLVRFAAVYILLVALTAVFVPFLANSRPYTIVINAHGGRPAMREFPLFRSLTRLDLILLALFAAAFLYSLVHWRTRRWRDLPRRRRVRWRWLGLLAALAVIASILIAILRHNVLDVRNYRRLVRQGRARDAIFAPIRWGYAGMEPLRKNLINQRPSRAHWLGTDGDGRDVLSRLLWSCRIAMGVGFVSQLIALSIGLLFGSLTGYFSGLVDLLSMRFVEIVESIPTFFLILTFVAIYGRDIFMIMVIIGVTGWTGYARFIRAEFLRIRRLDYVAAAHAAGLPLWRILFRHMLPNGLTPVLVSASFGFAGAVSIEATLSFLGVGVPPPTPSWGNMLNAAGNPTTVFRWWQALPPGLLLFITVLAFNIIGESLRDALDPKLAVN